MGAAGRDFHNFILRYKDDESVEVVAFTATQIPGIDDRRLPPGLAGPLYPEGIPIYPEEQLTRIIAERQIDEVVFSYSDLSHLEVMHRASRVLASGPDFQLLGMDSTAIRSSLPVVSVCAVRTGVGKSGITRRVLGALREEGLRPVVLRHPMPYRELVDVERFATPEDLFGLTLEEREEFEQILDAGGVVFAGVDYTRVVEEAEKEADLLIWDGGNNDLPFLRADLDIVALDPHRAGHECTYHPGEANFLRADVLVVNKINTADPADVAAVIEEARRSNPAATLIQTASVFEIDDPEAIRGARVLVIEDGPTTTHGGMAYGAGLLAAKAAGAAEIVDPRPYAKGSLERVFRENPHLTSVLPAVGYSPAQLADLAETTKAAPCDVIAIGTPIDLARVVDLGKPSVRVRYSVADASAPTIDDLVSEFTKGIRAT